MLYDVSRGYKEQQRLRIKLQIHSDINLLCGFDASACGVRDTHVLQCTPVPPFRPGASMGLKPY